MSLAHILFEINVMLSIFSDLPPPRSDFGLAVRRAGGEKSSVLIDMPKKR